MEYGELRRVERLEKDFSKLVQLDEDFYIHASELVRQCKAKAKESHDDARLLENIVKTLKNIYEYREQKILAKAQHDVRVGSNGSAGLTPEEVQAAARVYAVLKEAREDFEAVLLGQKKAARPSINDIPELGGTAADFMLVRFLKKIPKFVAADLKEYGPFETNEIARLPVKEAELLFTKSLAERV